MQRDAFERTVKVPLDRHEKPDLLPVPGPTTMGLSWLVLPCGIPEVEA